MNELLQLLNSIKIDLYHSIDYIPMGIFWGIVTLPAGWLYQKVIFRTEKAKWKIMIAWFCAVVYVYITLNIVFFSREPGSRTGLDLHLFDTYSDDMLKNRFILENIIMFIPYGILFPYIFPFLQKGRWCILAGCFCSTGIEMMQYITQRGHCQLDDIVMNTLGAFLGWLIYRRIC